MIKKHILEFYFFFILFSAIKEIFIFFSKESPIFMYFQILNAFHPPFSISYILNIAQIFINIISCVPLYFSIHKQHFLNPFFWKIFFIIKCFLDIWGRPYETQQIFSAYHSNSQTTVILLSINLLVYIPWYFFLFYYAFKPHNLTSLLKKS